MINQQKEFIHDQQIASFLFSGFKKLLLNRPYDGEVSMLLAPITNQPTKGPACLDKCPACATSNQTKPEQKQNTPTVIKEIGDKCDNNNEQSISSSNLVANIKDSAANENADDGDDMHTMKTVTGKFFMVNGANISCACPRSPNGFSKYCHLCDGYIDLILVRHTTFFNNLRFLMAMSSRNCKIVSIGVNLMMSCN